jgi:DNA polymerase-1
VPAEPATESAPLLAVDAPFLLYRSFFALPESITGVDDRPVGALLGAANLLLRAAAELNPRAVAVCFGAEEAPYRTELFAGYHAARPPMPDALRWQFEQAPALFQGFGWHSEGSEELEADDLLGSYAQAEAAAGGRTLILTGDRDMYQCAGASTTILYLKQKQRGFEHVDRDEVVSRYGIEPEQVPDFIALRGDPSDGLPGAPGIGEKTAGEILRRHGSLAAALAAVGTPEAPRVTHDERPRIAAALRGNAPLLQSFKEIATLRTVPLERPSDGRVDFKAAAAAASALGMGQLAGRLEAGGSLGDL